MNMTANQMTFRELLDRFADEDACKRFLVQRRWPDGVIRCPRCREKAYTLKARPFHYLCKSGKESMNKETGEVTVCQKKNGYRFSVITRTVFENTNIKLRDWFKVIFLMFHSKKGMSALQIHRMLGTGSYETAWFMCHRIRAAMKGDVIGPLEGEVEVDETYIGGRNRFRHANKRTISARGGHDKMPVIGAIARKGNVVCQALSDGIGFDTLADFVSHTVSPNVKLLATDEAFGYRHLREQGYEHQTVNHGHKQYVVGKVHTNTIENFWSLLKRGILGSYHHVSSDYLPLYVNEFAFRFNNRKNPDIFEAILAGC